MRDLVRIVWKELVQVSSRRRFHFEKGLFAAAAAGAFALVAMRETALSPEAFKVAAAFSRMIFFPVVIASYAVLSVVALVASSGIIVNEIIGKRLDLLRVTSISVGTIVVGKGVAVMGRSLLVAFLLMPVLASMQFYGGVSIGDLAMSFLLIVANLLLFTAVGLWISAGSSTGTERAVRVFNAGVIWAGLLYWFVSFAASRWTNSPYLVSLSPIWSLRMLAAGSLRWGPAAFSISVYVLLAAAFLIRSLYVTPRNLARLEAQQEAPNARDLGAGLKSLMSGVMRWGPLKRLRLGGHIQLSALVATEVRQTSVLILLIVPAVLLSMFGIVASGLALGRITRWVFREFVQTGSSLLIVAIALVVALQACSLIAREKSRRTIAQLVLTPSGGIRMLAWKGAALVANQGVWIAAAVAAIVAAGLLRGATGLEIVSQIASLAVTVLFLFVLGCAFSLLSSSTGFACGLLALSLFVMTPLAMRITAFLGAFLGRSALAFRSDLTVPAVLLALGVLGLFWRNAWPWAPGLFLAVSAALALGAAPVVTGLHDHGTLAYEPPFILSASFVFSFWHISMHHTVVSSVVKVIVAIALLVGMPLRFTRRAVPTNSKE